ncbi:MAG: DUF805 domain-containing protein [Patescibacteria group bacterium]
MITFDGLINRREYWKNLVVGVVFLFVFFYVTLAVLSLLDARQTDTNLINQVMTIALFASLCIGLILWQVWVLGLIVRRARDAGSVVAWVVVAILTPLGFLTIGLPPSRKQKK